MKNKKEYEYILLKKVEDKNFKTDIK
jgi:hypothetical protein